MKSLLEKSMIVVVLCLAMLAGQNATALPPTGLTQIRETSDSSADLAVIDGVAYASSMDGIYVIGAAGVDSLIVPATPPAFNSLIDTTRVVQTTGSDIFYLADFDGSGVIGGPRPGVALFNLNNPLLPTAVWGGDLRLARGIDRNLRGFGHRLDGATIELFPDGTASELTVGPPADFFSPGDVTPNGTAIGSGVPTGTIGTAPAILLPNGEVEFLNHLGGGHDIRERADGNGVNASYVGEEFGLKYGGNQLIHVDESIGANPDFEGGVQVSETNLAVLEVDDGAGGPPREFEEFRGYYPGVNPAGIDRSVSLFDLFPELNTLDFNRVLDLASSEGQIHMLLSGHDGLWLFAAPDPSLIPEPTGLTLFGFLVAMLCTIRRRR